MTFDICFGIPEIRDFWINLTNKVNNHTATKDEIKLFMKLKKTLMLLSSNPKHSSLNSHEIAILSIRYGQKVWESYIENKKPAAGRLFWVYYPPGSITIIGFEKHPNNTEHSYKKITLSSTNV